MKGSIRIIIVLISIVWLVIKKCLPEPPLDEWDKVVETRINPQTILNQLEENTYPIYIIKHSKNNCDSSWNRMERIEVKRVRYSEKMVLTYEFFETECGNWCCGRSAFLERTHMCDYENDLEELLQKGLDQFKNKLDNSEITNTYYIQQFLPIPQRSDIIKTDKPINELEQIIHHLKDSCLIKTLK